MATKIYVGNLPDTATGDLLRALFEGFGEVEDAVVVREPATPSPHGLVTMRDSAVAKTAAAHVHGIDMDGHSLTARVE